ncbi:hypothetical protein GCM10010327_33710 [Streptomyces nitrosporeus]|nr:hypothetical protein GCM10010327_33710 [Streptomyces nitrosporeus]
MRSTEQERAGVLSGPGWHIVYQVATAGLAGRAVKAWVERAATHGERWSDHAPVTVTYGEK